jgi:hypothetical protein
MSLIVNDRATDKQIAMLKKLEYYGDLNLSMTAAAQLIDEYFEEQRLAQQEHVYDLEGHQIDTY